MKEVKNTVKIPFIHHLNRSKKFIYIVVFSTLFSTLFLAILLIFVTSDFGLKNKVYENTYVGGVNVSGLSKQELEGKIGSLADEIARSNIILIDGGNKISVPYKYSGVEYLPIATSDYIYSKGRDRGFIQDELYRFRSFFVANNYAPLYKVNYNLLQSSVEANVSRFEQAPANASIVYKDGEFQITTEKNGYLVNKSKIYALLKKNVENFENLPIPITGFEETPEITSNNSKEALSRVQDIARENLVLNYDGQSWKLGGQDLINIIRLYPSGYEAEYLMSFDITQPVYLNSLGTSRDAAISLDEKKLGNFVDSIASEINRPAQNATLKFDNGRVSEFRPAIDGLMLDTDATQKLILEKLTKTTDGSKNFTVDLPVSVSRAKIADEKINSLGIKELVARGISYYYHSIPNRVFNIGLGASLINGTLIAPGETFSFDKIVGPVSAEQGFKQAYVISSGRTVLDDGGGICQVSTTLFRAVLNAGLPIVSRTAHAYRVGYYEQGGFQPGFDATVWSPSVDFQFKNDTNHYLLIQAIMSPEISKLEFDIYGTRDDRKVEVSNATITNVTPAPPDKYQDDPTLPKGTIKQVDFAAAGANVVFYRKVYKGGKLVIDEAFHSNYRPWQAIFLIGTGS